MGSFLARAQRSKKTKADNAGVVDCEDGSAWVLRSWSPIFKSFHRRVEVMHVEMQRSIPEGFDPTSRGKWIDNTSFTG